MARHALISMVVALSACAPALKLTRGADGWRVDDKGFAIEATRDGRVMGDGWLLQNYEKVARGHYAQRRSADVDLTFSRADDDGVLAVEQLSVERKKLRVLVDRLVNELRTRTLEVQAGNFRARVDVDEPVIELASAPLAGEGVEGYEIVVSQTHRGERAPYLHVYLALVRGPATGDVVVVSYVNSPAAFAAGLDDVRALTRRVKVGGASLAADQPPLAPNGTKPAPGAPIRL
ncbi:MAG: hypothetical protein JNK82_43815 [Myxococcaceae bacterium]|nr:hypothetical protein [Myxococcaceae bacterium]